MRGREKIDVSLLFVYHLDLVPVDVSRLGMQMMPIRKNTPVDVYIYFKLTEKTGVPLRAALNTEPISDYKGLMRLRGPPKEGLVFDGKQGKRLRLDWISRKIEELVDEVLPEDRAEEFRTGDRRESFNRDLIQAEITRDINDSLMGHERRTAREYYAMAHIIDSYKNVFEYLSIDSHA